MTDRKVAALLPMKGHSERIADKNIKVFAGEPLFYRILSVLDESSLIGNIIINTDRTDIADMAGAKSSKVVVHRRPEELCGDFVPMNEIIRYDIEHSDYEVYLQTHSTNPLVKRVTMEAAVEKFFQVRGQGYDSLFSVTRYQTRLYDSNGDAVNHNPAELLRTQDLPVLYEENSCFYIFSRESFFNGGNRRIGAKPFMYEIDKLEAIDIDTEYDFLLAEAVFEMRKY